jgi:hypothetical protein
MSRHTAPVDLRAEVRDALAFVPDLASRPPEERHAETWVIRAEQVRRSYGDDPARLRALALEVLPALEGVELYDGPTIVAARSLLANLRSDV